MNLYSCIELNLVHAGPSHCSSYDGPRQPIDVVIITAVREEYNAVRQHLHPDGSSAWSALPTVSNGIWQTSLMSSKKKEGAKLRLALVKLSKMGLSSAASITALSIQLFRPSLVVMVGITAGLKGKTRIGDIIVPSVVWDYGGGKWSDRDGKKFFQQRIRQHDLGREIDTRCDMINDDVAALEEIHEYWTKQNQITKRRPPRVLVEPLVSGAAVVNSKAVWDEVLDQDDKVVAIEMEAYGVLQAVTDARYSPYFPQCLIAKSVCDYGFRKNKKAQSYAAFTSVRFLRMYLERFALDCDAIDSPCRTNVMWRYESNPPPVHTTY